jgi:hypothetical protein
VLSGTVILERTSLAACAPAVFPGVRRHIITATAQIELRRNCFHGICIGPPEGRLRAFSGSTIARPSERLYASNDVEVLK